MAERAEARVLAGKYRVDDVLGRGGMGVVHRGEHLLTGRPVAVKLLRGDTGNDPTLAKRFVREVKAAAGLVHPNVVSVLDFGIDDDGTAFQVLELLEGEALSHRIARGPIAPKRTLELLLPIVHALGLAHARGVVHRDIKPANVLLSTDARGRVVPKLLDFGIAKVRATEPANELRGEATTEVGAVIGTPSYMSPEQARGASDVGSAGDVWAMGVLLYECLSGRLPFEDENASLVLARVMLERAPSLATKAPHVPGPIAAVIDRALEPDPSARPASMTVFAELLRAAAVTAGVPVPEESASDCAPEEEVPATPVGTIGRSGATHVRTVDARLPTPPRTRRVSLGLVAVLVIAVVTGVALAANRPLDHAPTPTVLAEPAAAVAPSPPAAHEPIAPPTSVVEVSTLAPPPSERPRAHVRPPPTTTVAAPPPTTAPMRSDDALPEIRGW